MYSVMLLTLKLLQVQFPSIPVPFQSMDEFFIQDSYYFGTVRLSKIHSYYPDTLVFQQRNIFSGQPSYYVRMFSGYGLSGIYSSTPQRKIVGGYIKNWYGPVYVNGYMKQISDSVFYRTSIGFRNRLFQFSGIYHGSGTYGFSFSSQYGGIVYSNESRLLWIHLPLSIVGIDEKNYFLYTAIPVIPPVFLVHLYYRSDGDYYVSPLYLFSEKTSVYLVFSDSPSVGYRSGWGGIEAGYSLEKGKANISGFIDSRNLKLSFISESTEEWRMEGYILSHFKEDNVNVGVYFRRKFNSNGLYAYARFYGLRIYGGVEVDSTLTINPQFLIYLDLED